MTLVLQYLSYMDMLGMPVSGQPSNMFESPYLGLLPLFFPLHQSFLPVGTQSNTNQPVCSPHPQPPTFWGSHNGAIIHLP